MVSVTIMCSAVRGEVEKQARREQRAAPAVLHRAGIREGCPEVHLSHLEPLTEGPVS